MWIVTSISLPRPVPVSALRVYQPREAFTGVQWRRWRDRALDPAAAEAAQRALTWRRVLSGTHGRPSRIVRGLRIDGEDLICPTGGLPPAAAPSGGAGPGPSPALPAVGLDPLSGELMMMAPMDLRSPELVRPWELPLAWSLLVRSADRAEDRGPACYLVGFAVARERAEEAGTVFAEAFPETGPARELRRIRQWLEGFPGGRRVEVALGPVAALVGGEDGVNDAQLGWESLLAGDATAVAAAYRRIRRRARNLADLARAS